MKFRSSIFLLCAVTVCWSCNRLPVVGGDEYIARVGDQKLYRSDIVDVVPAGVSSEDSVQIIDSYVDMWIKSRLKVQQAEELFRDNNHDIEQMVSEYRNSLMGHKIEQYHIAIYADTVITPEQVKEFYGEHRQEFILDRALVKGRVIAVTGDSRQLESVRNMLASTGERLQDLRDFSRKNNFEFTEYEQWTEIPEFFSFLPVDRHAGLDILRSGVQQIDSDNGTYLYYISSVLRQGDMNPLERVEDIIIRVLLNQRRQDALRRYEDSIYNRALRDKTIEIRTGNTPG